MDDDTERGATAVAEVARAHGDDIERQRRLPDPLVEALRASGLNRMFLPQVLGGDAVAPAQSIEAIATVAAADGSAGWCLCIGAATKVFAGYVPESSARTIWTDPDAANATVFGPPGSAVATDDGRYVMNGRWPFTSNCCHSDWLGLAAWFKSAPEADPEPAPRIVFVPRDAVEIHDTWDAVGLRGTGSHDTSVTELEIDRASSCAFHEPPWVDEPNWRLPVFTALMPPLAAVPLGVARGAVDELIARTAAGVTGMRGTLAADPVGMADLAAADAALRAAHAGVLTATDDAWRLAQCGEKVDKAAQARVLMSCHHAVDVAVEVTSTIHRLAGGAAAYSRDRLTRALRDVQTVRQHIAFGHGGRPVLAQALAGGDPFAPPFLL